MTIDSVSVDTVKEFGIIDHDDDDEIIEKLIMPAATTRVLNYTGMSEEEILLRDDIALAFVALCVFMYENRSFGIQTDKENRVIADILDGHRQNLVGG